jgi:hypothetical protein
MTLRKQSGGAMNTVIYYPYISPRPEWLKLAALSWNKVYRLVPSYGSPDDSDVVRELDEALGGILEPVYVAQEADQEVQEQFWRWVDARKERLEISRWSPDESREREVITGLGIGKFAGGEGGELLKELQRQGLARVEEKQVAKQIPTWVEEARAKYPMLQMTVTEESLVDEPEPGSDHEKYLKLLETAHNTTDSKRADALRKEAKDIRQRNLVTVTEQGPVIYLPVDIASHYLSLCAARAAENGRRDLVADGAKFTDAVFHDYSVRSEVSTAILEAYLPKDLSNLRPERIAEFRSEFSARRLEYQTTVQEMVDKYEKTSSEGELEDLKKQMVILATEQVERTKKTYRRAKQDMVIKTIGISLTPPATIAFVASALSIGILGPVGIATALSLFGAGLLLEWDKARSERAKSPWSYVLDARSLGN